MKANNRIYTIVAIMIALFFIIRYAYFEKVEVPAIPTGSMYDYVKKDASSLWLFRNLIEEGFDEVSVENEKENIFTESEQKNIIYIGPYISFEGDEVDQLIDAVDKGKHILISSNSTSMSNDDLYINTFYKYSVDSIYIKNQEEGLMKNEINKVSYYNQSMELNEIEFEYYPDSSAFEIVDGLFFADVYDYDRDTMSKEEVIDTLMFCKTIGEGKLCIHSIPRLFTNISSLSPGYLSHYNEVVKLLSKEGDVLLIRSGKGGQSYANPLRFLWNQRAFKYAFLLLGLLIVIYFFAESRRRTREIPLTKRKENTTLDFIETISRLYLKKGSNEDLFDKMEDNFYNFIQSRYYLNRNQEDFWEKVASKSKVNEATINRIRNEFKSKRQLTDQELATNYNILNLFYKTAE